VGRKRGGEVRLKENPLSLVILQGEGVKREK